MRAVLDPHYFACHVGLRTDSVAGHVEGILELFRETRDEDLELLTSDALFDALSSAGLYPLRETYEDFLRSGNVRHIGAGDLARLVLRLLEQSSVLEDVAPEADLASCGCARAGLLNDGCECHSVIHSAFEATLHSYAAATIVDPAVVAAFLATARTEPRSAVYSIEFNAVLSAKDEIFEDAGADVSLVGANHMTHYLLTAEMPDELKRASVDSQFCQSAIAGAVLQAEPDADVTWSLADDFVGTVAAAGILSVPGLAPKFLRTCSEVLLGRSSRDTHWIRTGAGGNSPQYKSDGAAAWRADIDRDLHLHYWKMPDGSTQFASVVHHNDFTIPNPEFDRPVVVSRL